MIKVSEKKAEEENFLETVFLLQRVISKNERTEITNQKNTSYSVCEKLKLHDK